MASHGTDGALTREDFLAATRADARDSEKRTEPRHRHKRMIQLLPELAAEDWRFIWAELTDCSANGLGLLVPEAMKPGQDFLVKLRLERELLLLYTVRHCKRETGGHRIGAKFTGLASDPVRRDPQAVLKALLAPSPDEPRDAG